MPIKIKIHTVKTHYSIFDFDCYFDFDSYRYFVNLEKQFFNKKYIK